MIYKAYILEIYLNKRAESGTHEVDRVHELFSDLFKLVFIQITIWTLINFNGNRTPHLRHHCNTTFNNLTINKNHFVRNHGRNRINKLTSSPWARTFLQHGNISAEFTSKSVKNKIQLRITHRLS